MAIGPGEPVAGLGGGNGGIGLGLQGAPPGSMAFGLSHNPWVSGNWPNKLPGDGGIIDQ